MSTKPHPPPCARVFSPLFILHSHHQTCSAAASVTYPPREKTWCVACLPKTPKTARRPTRCSHTHGSARSGRVRRSPLDSSGSSAGGVSSPRPPGPLRRLLGSLLQQQQQQQLEDQRPSWKEETVTPCRRDASRRPGLHVDRRLDKAGVRTEPGLPLPRRRRRLRQRSLALPEATRCPPEQRPRGGEVRCGARELFFSSDASAESRKSRRNVPRARQGGAGRSFAFTGVEGGECVAVGVRLFVLPQACSRLSPPRALSQRGGVAKCH